MTAVRKPVRRVGALLRRRRLGLEWLEPRLPLALNVPAFSSLPGANHTIYLDFDGHVTQGTYWNDSVASIHSPAYSTDSDSANFSAAELANIQNAWKRVAEDFAPFNVNVTTVAPPVADLINSGSGDSAWGVRVVITKDVAFRCGCGGIAYINSFNWNSDTPVFVFNSSLVGVAEAASHEAGHALGLSHDGTSSSSYYTGHGSGSTSWSAIMGVGYYVNVSQWDKGEYYNSNNRGSSANYGKGPDDLNVITTYNGFGYRADDHGNAAASSTPLAIAGTAVSGSGIIERASDVDMFQFTAGAGNVSLNVDPISSGANLDIKADLYDSSGQLIASANPSSALNASIDQTLAAGTYYLRVDGAGVGSPAANPPSGYSDYASLGQYTISGNLVAATSDVLSISAVGASRVEGDSGLTPFTFTVTRSGELSATTTVDWSASGSGSSSANSVDFDGGRFPAGSLQFDPGESSKTITVNVAGDATVESSEGFSVTLSNASGETAIGVGTAGGMIENDDTPPASPVLGISATDANRAEGTGATPTSFVFSIIRGGDTSQSSTVRYSVVGTSRRKASSSDFQGGFPKNITVSFSPGQSIVEISLNVIGDSKRESNEKFKVTLSSPVNATLGTKSATGTILNDDTTASGRGRAPEFAQLSSDDNDEVDEVELDSGADVEEDRTDFIAVADPLWMFQPPEMLTAEQLAVPVVTVVRGEEFVGDLTHDHSHDWEFDHWDGEDYLPEPDDPMTLAVDTRASFNLVSSDPLQTSPRQVTERNSTRSSQLVDLAWEVRAQREHSAIWDNDFLQHDTVDSDYLNDLTNAGSCADWMAIDALWSDWL